MSSHEAWREALKLIQRCPICSATYDGKRVKVFAQQDNATMVHITCPKCASYFVAMIVVAGHGLSTMGLVTDLSYQDTTRLFSLEPVTTDEVIRGHEFIHNRLFLHSLILDR